MQLYIFYLGGTAPKANIELHDVQFVAVEKLEQAFPLLREMWFGDPRHLHVDSYAPINWADGYQVSLQPEPYVGDKQLYFVNLGGYQNGNLAELHQFGLFVASSMREAKEKAKQQLLVGAQLQHKDDLLVVDDCLALSQVNGYHVHLTAQPEGKPFHQQIDAQRHFMPVPPA